MNRDGLPVEAPEETRLAWELNAEPPIMRAQADAFVLIAESFVATGPVGERGEGLEVLVHANLRDLADLVSDTSGNDTVNDEDSRPSQDTWTRSVDGQPLLSTTALRRR